MKCATLVCCVYTSYLFWPCLCGNTGFVGLVEEIGLSNVFVLQARGLESFLVCDVHDAAQNFKIYLYM